MVFFMSMKWYDMQETGIDSEPLKKLEMSKNKPPKISDSSVKLVCVIVQNVILLMIISAAVLNLSLNKKMTNSEQKVWLVLLGTALGTAMPSPKWRKTINTATAGIALNH